MTNLNGFFACSISRVFDFFKTIGLGVAILAVGTTLYNQLQIYIEREDFQVRAATPATDFMEVFSIEVEDTPQYKDPWILTVKREIKYDYTLSKEWRVGVYKKNSDDTETTLCNAVGVSNNYSNKSRIDTPVHLLSWWMGVKNPSDACDVWPFPIGETCMRTSWVFMPPDYPLKILTFPELYSDKQVCWQTIEAQAPD